MTNTYFRVLKGRERHPHIHTSTPMPANDYIRKFFLSHQSPEISKNQIQVALRKKAHLKPTYLMRTFVLK